MPRAKKVAEPVEDQNKAQDRIAALEAELAQLKADANAPVAAPVTDTNYDVLARALNNAIQAAKPVEKKTIINYKGDTPWHKAGEVHTKAKRRYFIHSMVIDPDFHNNAEVALFNKVRPGRYVDGFVTVERRRDKGINIHWPIKTPDQKMRLASRYGIISLTQLLQRCVDEAAAPKKEFVEDDE